eukprot:6484992-Amphidinium_carterae.2
MQASAFQLQNSAIALQERTAREQICKDLLIKADMHQKEETLEAQVKVKEGKLERSKTKGELRRGEAQPKVPRQISTPTNSNRKTRRAESHRFHFTLALRRKSAWVGNPRYHLYIAIIPGRCTDDRSQGDLDGNHLPLTLHLLQSLHRVRVAIRLTSLQQKKSKSPIPGER